MGVMVFVLLAMMVRSLSDRRVSVVQAYDMDKLDEALPKDYNISEIYPVFDFDADGCLPSSAIGRKGQLSLGLKATGGNGNCRYERFMDSSNTYHRYACVKEGSVEYCGHSFALYMLKDKVSGWLMSGHRHDWEYVIIWTKNGIPSHASYTGRTFESITTQNGHPQFVYHQLGSQHHKFRPAKANEDAENPYKEFVTPTIISWFTMKGDGVSNKALRKILSDAWFGWMTPFPHSDSVFLERLNNVKPESFPAYTQASIDTAK